MVGVAIVSTRMAHSRDRLRRTVMTVLAVYWVLCLVTTGLSAWVIGPHLPAAFSEQGMIIYRALTALNFSAYAALAFVTVRAINGPVRWEWRILWAVLVFLVLAGSPYAFAIVLSAMEGNGWMSVVYALRTPAILLMQILFLRWSRA